MAYHIYNQPEKIGYARTPILYLIGEDILFTEDSFEYIAEVYLWQGLESEKPSTPEYELRKPPNTSFGNALFDIRTLSTDWLITPEFDIEGDPDKTTEMYVWAQVHFGYTYVDSGGLVQEAKNVEIGNPINVYNGYTKYLEGVNFQPVNNYGTTPDSFWLTDSPLKRCVPLYTSQYLFAINDPASTVRRVYIDVNDGDVVSILDLDLFTSELVAVGCGTREIQDLYTPPDYVINNYTVYGAEADGTPVTQVYEFEVDCNLSCKYGFLNLQFLNRYGVWDNIVMYGAKRYGMEVDRTEILHSPLELVENTVSLEPEFLFNKGFGQFHMAGVSSRESLNINSGWIDEDWNEALSQMMQTHYLYDPDTNRPFTISDSQIQFKTHLNDKLINYTIQLKFAHTAVNSVG